MPNLIGMNLQAAQDLLQAKGSYLLDQEDATPPGQNPSAGQQLESVPPEPGRGDTDHGCNDGDTLVREAHRNLPVRS